MGEKVTLVRPDGSLFNVDKEQASKFAVLGYREETAEELQGRTTASATEDFYSTPGQQLTTGVEGVASGLTLGLSDVAADSMNWSTDLRAQYNPGTRIAGELVGSLLPLAPGLGALKTLTPAGALLRGGEAIGAGLAARGIGKTIARGVQGAVEGAGFGAGSALADATLNGDPLTVEAISAGVGFGALFGGGLSALGGAVIGRAEARAAKMAATEAAEAATRDAFQAFRGSVTDLSENVAGVMKAVDATENVVKEAKDISDKFLRPLDLSGANFGSLRAMRTHAAKALNGMTAAARAGDHAELQAWQEVFQKQVTQIAEGAGMKAPGMAPLIEANAKYSVAAMQDAAAMAASAKYLKEFPTTLEAFASTTPQKADKLIGAIDSVMGVSRAEFAGLQEGIKNGVSMLAERMGVTVDGPVSTQLRGLFEAAKAAVKEGTERAVTKQGLPWLASAARQGASYTAGSMMSRAAGNMGASTIGRTVAYEGGKRLIQALLGMKSFVVGSVADAAATWAPRAARAAKPVGTRLEALRVRLDGTEDKGKKDARDLMAARSQELRDAAGSVRDVIYKNIQGLAEYHPELAAGLHAHEVKKFEFILNKLPRDPGLAFNRMNSLWRPSPVEMEKFSRYYEVFHNPHAVMTAVLKGSRVLPEWAEGLREMYPALWTDLRFNMLNRLGDPKVLNKLSYSEQVNLGMLLDIPIHSTMMPQFIVNQQQMYMDRNQPLAIPPQSGMDSGGGRPPGPANDPRASSGQKVTSH